MPHHRRTGSSEAVSRNEIHGCRRAFRATCAADRIGRADSSKRNRCCRTRWIEGSVDAPGRKRTEASKFAPVRPLGNHCARRIDHFQIRYLEQLRPDLVDTGDWTEAGFHQGGFGRRLRCHGKHGGNSQRATRTGLHQPCRPPCMTVITTNPRKPAEMHEGNRITIYRIRPIYRFCFVGALRPERAHRG